MENQQNRESDQYAKKKQKLNRLLAKPRHDFKDEDYEQARSELTANVGEAVEEGFKKAQQLESVSAGASGLKRKMVAGKATAKKSHLWIANDLSSGSEDSTDESDEEDAPKQKKSAAVSVET